MISILQKIITLPGTTNDMRVDVTVNVGVNDVTHVLVEFSSLCVVEFCILRVQIVPHLELILSVNLAVIRL